MAFAFAYAALPHADVGEGHAADGSRLLIFEFEWPFGARRLIEAGN